MKVDPADLIGTSEFAEILGVQAQAVSTGKTRGVMPEPVAVLRCGPLWTRSQAEELLADRIAQQQERVAKLQAKLEAQGKLLRKINAQLSQAAKS